MAALTALASLPVLGRAGRAGRAATTLAVFDASAVLPAPPERAVVVSC